MVETDDSWERSDSEIELEHVKETLIQLRASLKGHEDYLTSLVFKSNQSRKSYNAAFTKVLEHAVVLPGQKSLSAAEREKNSSELNSLKAAYETSLKEIEQAKSQKELFRA